MEKEVKIMRTLADEFRDLSDMFRAISTRINSIAEKIDNTTAPDPQVEDTTYTDPEQDETEDLIEIQSKVDEMKSIIDEFDDDNLINDQIIKEKERLQGYKEQDRIEPYVVNVIGGLTGIENGAMSYAIKLLDPNTQEITWMKVSKDLYLDLSNGFEGNYNLDNTDFNKLVSIELNEEELRQLDGTWKLPDSRNTL